MTHWSRYVPRSWQALIKTSQGLVQRTTARMAGNANLWVLDFLLEADGLDDTLIKHFHDVNASQFEELPPNTQARLMLRVLRDAPAQPTGIAEAALGALNMLKNLAEQLPENFAPGANLEALKPSQQLLTEVSSAVLQVLVGTVAYLERAGKNPLSYIVVQHSGVHSLSAATKAQVGGKKLRGNCLIQAGENRARPQECARREPGRAPQADIGLLLRATRARGFS